MQTDDLGGGDYGEPAGIGDNNPPKTYADELRQEHQDLFLRLDALKLERGKLPGVVNGDAELEVIGAFVKTARDLEKAVDKAHKKGSADLKAKAKTWDAVFLTRGLCGEIANLRAVAQALADDYIARKEAAERRRLKEEADRLRELEGDRAYEAQTFKGAGSHAVAEVVESQAEHIGKRAERLETKAAGKTADVVRTSFDGLTAGGRSVSAYEVEDLAAIDLNRLKDVFLEHELTQVFQRYADRHRGDPGASIPGLRVFTKVVSTFR